MVKKVSLFVFLFISFLINIKAQPADSIDYPPVNEKLLFNSYWKYEYMTHAPTNTIIHKADASYEYFLAFRFDYTYDQYMHGTTVHGTWSLNNQKTRLYYPHKNIKEWKIVELNKKQLILEYNTIDGKRMSPHRYYYRSVKDLDSPFPLTTIPTIDVEDLKGKRDESRHASAKNGRPKPVLKSDPQPTFIKIELTGGGYYGGIDPTIKDYTVIKTDGRIIREIETLHKGVIKKQMSVSRAVVEKLVDFIMKKNFYKFSNVYDCADPDCMSRKAKNPRPVPLRLAVTYGERRKVITIAIWGKDDSGFTHVGYPEDLEIIIQEIQRLVNSEF